MVTRLTRSDRLLKVFNGLFLARVVCALLVMKPSKLLKHLRVVGIALEDPAVSTLCSFELAHVLAVESF